MNKNKTPRLFLSPPHMSGSELEFVKEAFASNYIAPLGPMVDAFEREFAEYTGVPFCLALSSGTAATHVALRHLLKVSGQRGEVGQSDRQAVKRWGAGRTAGVSRTVRPSDRPTDR